MALTKISSSEIQTGAITSDKISGDVSLGVKISNVSIANSTYTVLDDTAVNVGGGYIVVTGAGFQSGAQVIIDTTPATSTTFVNTTTLRAEVPAKSAATYNLYVANPDGGTAIKVNGLTYSGFPTWVTSSTLANVSSNTAFTGSLSATGATSYANTTALPSGFNLITANGYYYGNISVGSVTTYSFTVSATDAENQNSDRTFSLTAIKDITPTSVEYLVVAGGGGGGSPNGGAGGGAGGYRTGTLSVSASTPYTVTVGAGGTKGSGVAGSGVAGTQGGSSVFSSITSAGGGVGGNADKAPSAGGNGGSGGGGATYTTTVGSAGSGNTPSVSPSQGNNGGTGTTDNNNYRNGGGGGGASAVGGNATSTAGGNGGNGTTSSISGSSVAYAGGGGGGTFSAAHTGGSGGSGGGGAGQNGENGGQSGGTNTGGGGGGAGTSSTGAGNGGSGIVIIRYADTYLAATSTTGSPTVTTSGGYRIYTWTGSGSITF